MVMTGAGDGDVGVGTVGRGTYPNIMILPFLIQDNNLLSESGCV